MANRSYRIFWNAASQEPAGGVAVTADVPASWTEQVDATGAPKFTVPGLGTFSKPAITAVAASGDDDRARLESAIAQQLGADLASASRTDKGGGRVWIVARRASGHTHARLFLPAAAPGVVSASIVLAPDEASKLPEIERAFETIRVGA